LGKFIAFLKPLEPDAHLFIDDWALLISYFELTYFIFINIELFTVFEEELLGSTSIKTK
jgi:hypothetical protein